MLAYDYSAGSARLDDLPEVPISPHLYVLCERCAGSLRAPRGWILDDRRETTNGRVARPSAPVRRLEEPATEPEQTEDAGQRQLAFGYSA